MDKKTREACDLLWSRFKSIQRYVHDYSSYSAGFAHGVDWQQRQDRQIVAEGISMSRRSVNEGRTEYIAGSRRQEEEEGR